MLSGWQLVSHVRFDVEVLAVCEFKNLNVGDIAVRLVETHSIAVALEVFKTYAANLIDSRARVTAAHKLIILQ